eukprot:Plantae.Rhodophyta-Rhodochaete_pulchella.ctg6609.p1 GENE.Plantae.Rhodophyta-Rhodochaete_pulchella.ctg6609~~Plantae.Rhodophyta-Rhodochaete_pulchella.ctg6609.p1  ORF type:complete len:266 (-),score=30.64 Plantae.Rhodophyta-Rhodochaete_pulchella.ctg6609:39-836(-)
MTADDRSGRGSRLRINGRLFSSFSSSATSSNDNDTGLEYYESAARSLDSSLRSPTGKRMAIGDDEPSALSNGSRRYRLMKTSSGNLRTMAAASEESSGWTSASALRGWRDALKEKLDSQSRADLKKLRDNTRINRSKQSVQQLLKIISSSPNDVDSDFGSLLLSPRSPSEIPLTSPDFESSKYAGGTEESFQISNVTAIGESKSPRGTCGIRFRDLVEVRIVRDTGTTFVYENTQMTIDYTTRKHVETFEAHSIGADISEMDLLV